MDNELFNSVRKNTEMSFNRSIFDFFMNKYLDKDMTSYSTNDGEKLFDFIKINTENASPMNLEDYKELINKIIERTTRLYIFKGEAFDKKAVTERIVKSLNSVNKKLSFNTAALYEKPVEGDKSILLYFDIAGKDVIKVLNRIIKELDLFEVAYDITIPSFKQMEVGHTDAITIATSPEGYKKVVEVLERVKDDTKEYVKDNDYARDNWFGVNTVKDGKTADQVIGTAFIKALDTTLSELADSYPDIQIDGKSISEYLTNESNKDLGRQTVYKKILEIDNTIGDKVYELVLLDIKELGLDPDNVFVFDTVNEKLDSLYGPVKVSEVNEEVKNDEQIGDKLGAFVDSLDEQQKADQKVFDEILNKLELPDDGMKLQVTEPTKEIPPITDDMLASAPKAEPIDVSNVVPEIDAQVNTIKEEAEVSPSHDVEPMSVEEEIVDNTMNKVGEEVNTIIKNPVQASVAKSIADLTPEEKVSMAKAIDDTQETLEIENKYLGLLDGVEGWTFDSKVKDVDGNPITLLEYLEKNDTLKKVPFNSLVSLLDGTTEDGKEVTGKKFISKYVLDSLRLNESSPDSLGGLTLEEIMEKYIEKIELPEYGVIYPEGLTTPVKKDKDGLIKRLFKNKRSI